MPKARLSWAERPAADFDVSPAMSLLVSVQRAGLPLRHDCGGKAQCGTCRVRLVAGRLSPMGDRERLRLAAVSAPDGVRLACQARPGSDVVLEAVLPLARTGQGG